MDKRILIFSILYFLITALFILDISRDEIRSIEYILIFPAFWIFGIICLYILSKKTNINYRKTINRIGFIICTPLPYIVVYIIWLFIHPMPSKIVQYSINGKEVREIHFAYPDESDRKIEYWSTTDSISSYHSMDEIEYGLDSVLYFDHQGHLVENTY